MFRILVTLALVLVCGGGAFDGPNQPPSQPAAAASQPSPARFADNIQRFVEWDQRNSFPPDAVLFVGSSSIRMWATHASFPQWPVINRGFGGSEVAEVNHFFKEVVQPYRARVIVLYAGDNDIAAGRDPEQVRDDFAAFVKLVQEAQPETPIVFLSIKPSASRWQHWPRMQAANTLIHELCEKQPHLTFVDVATPLLGPDGQPRADLFLADKLHLSSAGYDVWARILTPVIEKLMRR
jgi:lysophospholipase L1-like esterase